MLNILFVSSEMAPFVKTGGLGDVASSLPRSLSAHGNKTACLLPLYGSIKLESLKEVAGEVSIDLAGRTYTATFMTMSYGSGREKTDVYFMRQEELFGNRPNPYGDESGDYADNDLRFIFFNRAAMEFAKNVLPFIPDVIHGNDWQCGLLPLYLKEEGESSVLAKTVSVFSMHNLAYQGHFEKSSFLLTGLPEKYFSSEGVEHYGKLALLKTAILFADGLTAVSETYAKEILGPELGFGLEKFLSGRKRNLKGILNGVDVEEWNPEKDKLIPARYSLKNMKGKKKCRESLISEFNLTAPLKSPLVGVVSRLIEQKGFDIVKECSERLMENDFSLVVLGAGQSEYEEFFVRLANDYPGRVGVKIGYDNALAHRIEAGADIFLMPSRFEPCGLNQMYSLRYGSAPIVRATGGLNDTVKNWNPKTGKGNGFVFKKAEAEDFLKTFKRALKAFGSPKEWGRIIENGMSEDFSWELSAEKYIAFYRSLVNKKG